MICISIAQESRRMALVDMLNAAGQCDLLEVRLDRFDKTPDLGDILTRKPKPVILSCRRSKDGGFWNEPEAARTLFLRQCIVNKPDYIELDLDIADEIRPFPGVKRVISYTNLQGTPSNLAEIYAQCQTKKPDVVKLMTLTRTPEEAWPLLQILARPAVPTVAVGIGRPGVMLSILGKKIGAPWVYAALERGMENYDGQPTVRDLREVYHYDAIEKGTRLIGVTGFGPREVATTAALNAAFATAGTPARCLPLGVGSATLFRKIIDAVRLAAVVVGEEHREELTPVANELDAAAHEARAVDLLVAKDKAWQGHNTKLQALVTALEHTLADGGAADRPLQGRMVMLVGTNPLARSIGCALQARGANLTVASHNRDAAQQLAKVLECRFVQFEALYTTMHDVLIVCEVERNPRAKAGEAPGVHPGYLKPGMVVLDLTAGPAPTPLLREAAVRGIGTVSPRRLLREQVAVQARLLLGKDVPREVLDAAFVNVLEEEG